MVFQIIFVITWHYDVIWWRVWRSLRMFVNEGDTIQTTEHAMRINFQKILFRSLAADTVAFYCEKVRSRNPAMWDFKRKLHHSLAFRQTKSQATAANVEPGLEYGNGNHFDGGIVSVIVLLMGLLESCYSHVHPWCASVRYRFLPRVSSRDL